MDKSQETDQMPEDLLFSALRDLRGGRDARETLVAITTALCKASEDGAVSGRQLKMFPNTHLVGFSKYSWIQDAFLLVGQELGLPVEKARHPGRRSSTYYAVLDHPRLRITLGHVQKYGHNPKLRPFRLKSSLARFRPQQLSMIDRLRVAPGEQLVATIVYGYEQYNRVTPAFMEVRYIDEDHYMPFATDLLEMRRIASAPAIEHVADREELQIRKRARRQTNG